LYFPKGHPKKLDQDEVIEILDQAKSVDHHWYEVMVKVKIDVFEISFETPTI
jgi:hypothetical protein